MKVFKPVQKIIKGSNPSLFLAGTIDNGHSLNWQEEATRYFEDAAFDIYNPRRDDWDSSWVQQATDPQFTGQVNWELEALEAADRIIMNFLPGSQSPVSLLELGLYARSKKLWVCCPDDYWKSGNVQLVCKLYAVPLFKTLPVLLSAIRQSIN